MLPGSMQTRLPPTRECQRVIFVYFSVLTLPDMRRSYCE